jgi:hypothetical protein
VESLDDSSSNPVNRVAESLYGLIHARYILSGPGLLAMVQHVMLTFLCKTIVDSFSFVAQEIFGKRIR